MLEVMIRRLPGTDDVTLPSYQSAEAAAMDLHAAVVDPLAIAPGQGVAVPCGFQIAVPPGHEAQVRPRSGLAAKHALLVPNSPGTIDADYRGEVKVLLFNAGKEPFTVTRAMRIAQMLIVPVPRVAWKEVAELPSTERGAGGFGSTGR